MKSVSVLVLSALLWGCGSDPKPPPAAPAGGNELIATTPAPDNPKPDDNPEQSNVNISEEIKKACGITESEAFFAYDSARIRAQDKEVFKKLATCFTSGPLAGREMRLVGHADSRGEDEYNMLLGERRAGNVSQAVVSEGLKAEQASTVSRGEMDATGTDEAGWSRDRRVDIVLGD